MYTRYGNPTVHALEEKIAALEGARRRRRLPPHGGRLLLILGYVKAGDHVVAARSLYGATYNFLNRKLPAMAPPQPLCNPPARRFREGHSANTRLIYLNHPAIPPGDNRHRRAGRNWRVRTESLAWWTILCLAALQQRVNLGITVVFTLPPSTCAGMATPWAASPSARRLH